MYSYTDKRGVTQGVVILGMLLLAGIVVTAIVRDRIVNNPWREVSITGTGKVAYTPDIALITLGVHVEDSTAQSALSRLNTIVHAVTPAIEALGIPAENISTQNFNVYPQYYYPEGSPSRISGYTADQQLLVKVSIAESQDIVAKVIETASANGANQVLGVSFDASNLEDLKHEALLQAIADAEGRAEETADAAGIKLGNITGWWQNQIFIPGKSGMYGYGYGGEMGGGGGGAPLITSGGQEIVVEVNVNYKIR